MGNRNRNYKGLHFLYAHLFSATAVKFNIEYVLKKFASKARCGNIPNMEQEIQLCQSTVEPHLNYCANIPFLTNRSELDRLQTRQKILLNKIL